MHHVAILTPRLHLLPKILSGRKTIESRWYKVRTAPFGRITKGDTVYFKDSGKPVTVKATVTAVMQFEDFTPAILDTIIGNFGGEGRLCLGDTETAMRRWATGKKHVILIFLGDTHPVAPFGINKSGFGSASAWLTVPHINQLKA